MKAIWRPKCNLNGVVSAQVKPDRLQAVQQANPKNTVSNGRSFLSVLDSLSAKPEPVDTAAGKEEGAGIQPSQTASSTVAPNSETARSAGDGRQGEGGETNDATLYRTIGREDQSKLAQQPQQALPEAILDAIKSDSTQRDSRDHLATPSAHDLKSGNKAEDKSSIQKSEMNVKEKKIPCSEADPTQIAVSIIPVPLASNSFAKQNPIDCIDCQAPAITFNPQGLQNAAKFQPDVPKDTSSVSDDSPATIVVDGLKIQPEGNRDPVLSLSVPIENAEIREAKGRPTKQKKDLAQQTAPSSAGGDSEHAFLPEGFDSLTPQNSVQPVPEVPEFKVIHSAILGQNGPAQQLKVSPFERTFDVAQKTDGKEVAEKKTSSKSDQRLEPGDKAIVADSTATKDLNSSSANRDLQSHASTVDNHVGILNVTNAQARTNVSTGNLPDSKAILADSVPLKNAPGVHPFPLVQSGHLVQTAQGSELRLNLYSSELGRIDIHGTLKSHEFVANIYVENQATEKALAASLPALEAKLHHEQRVIPQINLQIDANPDDRGGRGQQNQQGRREQLLTLNHRDDNNEIRETAAVVIDDSKISVHA